MKVFVQWLFRLLISLMLIAVIVPVAGTLLLDQEDLKVTIADWVRQQGGRELQIGGRLGFRPGLGLVLYAEDVRLENADWGRRPDAFRAARVEARVSLHGLLQGRVLVESVGIEKGVLFVEEGRPGQFNFDSFARRSGGGTARGTPSWLEMESLRLRDSTIHLDLRQRDWDIRIDSGEINADSFTAPASVDLAGSVQSLRVAVQGTLGTPSSWLHRQDSAAELDLFLAGREMARARGVVGDVLFWRDVDIELTGGLRRLRDITPWLFNEPLDLRNLAMSGRLRQPGSFTTMRFDDLQGTAEYHGLPIRAVGRVGRLSRLEDIDIRLSGQHAWDLTALPLETALPLQPDVSLSAVLTGESDRLHIVVDGFRMEGDGYRLAATGRVLNVGNTWQGSLPLTLEVDELSELGRQMDRDWPRVGAIRAGADLTRTDAGFALEKLQVRSTGGLAEVSGSGAVNGIGRSVSGSVRLTGRSGPEFFSVNGYLSQLDPRSAEVSATWRFEDKRPWLEIESLQLTVPGGELVGSGSIPDLTEAARLSLKLTGKLEDPGVFAESRGLDWPPLPAMYWTGSLRRESESRWTIDPLSVEGAREGEWLKAAGSMHHDEGKVRWMVDVEAEVAPRSIEAFAAESDLGRQLADGLDSVRATLRVTHENSVTGLQALTLQSHWLGAPLQVTGNLSRLAPATGRLAVNWEGQPSRSPPWPGTLPLPELRQVSAGFTVALPLAGQGIDDLNLALISERERLSVSGDIAAFSPLRASDLQVNLESRDVASLFPGVQGLVPGNALALEASVSLDGEAVSANGAVRIGDNDLTGDVHWQSAEDGKRQKLNGVLRSDSLDLTTLLLPGDKTGRLIPEDPLIPQWLQSFEGEVTLAVASFRNASMQLRDVRTVYRSRGDVLENVFEAHGGNGAVSGRILLPGQGDAALELVANGMPVSSFLALSREDVFQGGVIDAALTLRGGERTLAGLVDHGSGQIRLDIRQSKIFNKSLHNVGGDLVMNFLTSINPFQENKPYVEVECGAIYLDLADGKAATRNGMALKTDRVTVLGGGEISFPGEEIRVLLAPKARKGFGISASSIAKMIRLGGTLREPRIETDPRGLLKSGAALGAAIASGGVSLVALGLLDRLQANADVCAIARGRKQPVNGLSSQTDTDGR